MGYFAQHAMDLLDGERTVFQSLEDSFPQAGQGSLRALAGCFGFSGDDVEKKCRVLSGGEKKSAAGDGIDALRPARTSWCWTRPTNHLDMATKEMLITALSQYEGTMLFVSHDRHFLAAALEPGAGADARGHSPIWRRIHRICRTPPAQGGAGPAQLIQAIRLNGSDWDLKTIWIWPADHVP